MDRQDITQILESSLDPKPQTQPQYEKLSDKQPSNKTVQISQPFSQNFNQTIMSRQFQQKEDNVKIDTQNKKEKRRDSVHGHIYQLKLLMLFLYRGVSHGYSFRLGTEIEEAKKIDDVVFEYTQGDKKVYRLLQAKHKLDESKKIAEHSLLTEKNGDYSLIKYFFSYQDSKEEQLFKGGSIKDVIICTNIDFDFKRLKSENFKIEEVEDEDDILDVKSDKKKPMRYKFNEDVASKLKPRLEEYQARLKGKLAEISENEIKDFLNHLVFAVNQPNEEELGKIIKKEMGKEFDFISIENAYNKFFITILNWQRGKEGGRFLSYKEGKEFFEKVGKEISIWSPALMYENELEYISVQFRKKDEVDGFIHSGKKLWPVSSETPWLSSLVIYQALKVVKGFNRLLLKWSDFLARHKIILPAFEAMDKCLLIIVCQPTSQINHQELPKIVNEIEKIVTCPSSNSKQVIVIAPTNHELLVQLSKKLDIYSSQVLKIEFSDLIQESQEVCLKAEKIRFQGEDSLLNIKTLLGLEDRTSVPQAVLDKLNLGARELEMLLGNQIIEIWNKQLRLSHLESAHYKAHTRIDLDQLKQTLLLKNSEDRFIFVGEENKVKQLFPVDQQDVLTRFEGVNLPSDNCRFILLDTDQEEEQFKQLCQQVDKVNVEKKVGVVQPVLHLLKEEGKEWIWKQTYTRNFYIKRRFYPVMVNTEIKELVKKADSSDFIVFSGMNEEELLAVLKGKESDNLKRNTAVFSDEASAEKEFNRLSSDPTNQKKSIHWIKVNKVGGEDQAELQWCRSWGEVCRLRKKLKKDAVNHPIDEARLANENKQVVVLADEPGMGKSTTLAFIAELIKKKNPLSCVIKIDLNQHQQLLSSKPVKTKADVVHLLYHIYPILEKNPLAEKILSYQLERPGQVVLLWDGFDEVKPERQGAVLTLLKFLKDETAATIWVTTRKHDQERLEDSLSVLAHPFKPLNKAKEIIFFREFWTTTLKFAGENPDPLILKGYAKEIIQRFEQSIQVCKGDKIFINIPLRARMSAEIFQERVKKALAENKPAYEFFKGDENYVIGDLYQQFIDKKYGIYLREKMKVDEGLDKESQAILMKAYTKAYGCLAVKELFDHGEIAHFVDNKETFSLNTLSRIGLIQGNEQPVNFIHRTFAEYFAASWLAEHKKNSAVRKFLGIQLFKKASSVVRRFFDHFLTQGLLPYNTVLRGDVLAFKELLNKSFDISKTDGLGRTVLHIAAQEGSDEIIQYLWEENLVADQLGKTPLHYAACFGHDKVVNQLLRNLIDIDLDDHIFRKPLHFDTEIEVNSLFDNPEYTESDFVKLVNKQDDSGNPPLYYAVDNEYWNTGCNLLLHGANNCILTKENKEKLLLFAAGKTHGSGKQHHHLRPVVGLLSIQVPETVQGFSDDYEYPRLLSYFFRHGHTKVIDALLGSIKDFNRRKRIANKTDNGTTLLGHVENCTFNDADHLKIVKYLFNRDVYDGINIDAEVNVALHIAAEKGNLNTFKHLFEQGVVSEIGNYTPVARALIRNNQLAILEYLWENHRETINDSFGRTPLHVAAYSANLQAIYYLCTHGAKINAKDERRRTPLHYAAQAQPVPIPLLQSARLTGHQKIVQYLIEEQGADFNLVDEEEKTALDLAIEAVQWVTTDYLIKKNANSNDSSLISNLKQFFKSPFQDTLALQLAIRKKDTQWIRFLLKQEKVDVNCLDQNGRTPLHWAAAVDLPKIIERLLQRGAQYDVRDNNEKTALDLLKESNSEQDFTSSESIELLQLIEQLFYSKNLMGDLRNQLWIIESPGSNFMWHPDVYDPNNPIQFVLNARSIKRGTLLHIAADNGELILFKLLLEEFDHEYLQLKFNLNYSHVENYQAMDINVKDGLGNMPIHYAARRGHQEILLLLLQKGAVFNAENNHKHSPKILAEKNEHQAIVQFLQQVENLFASVKQGKHLDIASDTLAREALVHARDQDGKMLLHWAAQQGQIEMIQVLLDSIQGEVINALDHQHRTPLHEAATHVQTAAIRFLLQRGAQFNVKDKQGRTPLDCLPNSDDSLLKVVHQSFSDIQSNCPGTVIKVLQDLDTSHNDLNAIVQAKDEHDNTLLHWAAQEHYHAVVQQLLQRGAIYDVKNRQGETPQELGCHHSQINNLFQLIKEWIYDEKPPKFSVEEVVKDLDKLTIIKKARGCDLKTPLHVNRNYFRLKCLVKKGANLTLRDCEGNTPLHAAVESDDMAIAKLFLDQGVDVNAKNHKGMTPLDLSKSEIVTALLQRYENQTSDELVRAVERNNSDGI